MLPKRNAERSGIFAAVLSQDTSICLLQDKYCYNAGQESAYPPTDSCAFLKHFHNNYSFHALGLNHILLPKTLNIFLEKEKETRSFYNLWHKQVSNGQKIKNKNSAIKSQHPLWVTEIKIMMESKPTKVFFIFKENSTMTEEGQSGTVCFFVCLFDFFYLTALWRSFKKNTPFPTKLCTAEHRKHPALFIPVTCTGLSKRGALHNHNNLLSLSH